MRLTSEQWACYLDTPKQIVELINDMCEIILDVSTTPPQALKGIYKMLNNFQAFGFRDTECEWAAVNLINSYYQDEEDVDRWSVGFI
jgi:hypothetical protein